MYFIILFNIIYTVFCEIVWGNGNCPGPCSGGIYQCGQGDYVWCPPGTHIVSAAAFRPDGSDLAGWPRLCQRSSILEALHVPFFARTRFATIASSDMSLWRLSSVAIAWSMYFVDSIVQYFVYINFFWFYSSMTLRDLSVMGAQRSSTLLLCSRFFWVYSSECCHTSVFWFYSHQIFEFWGHSSKNLAGQLCTPIRNLLLGKFFVDHSRCLVYGMPSSAYSRAEPMSDLLNKILWNPYLVLPDIVPCHFIASL